MARFLFRASLGRFLGVAAVSLLTLPARGDQPAGQPIANAPRADRGKGAIELGPKKIIRQTAAAPNSRAPAAEAANPSRSDRLAVLVGGAGKVIWLDERKTGVIEEPVIRVMQNSTAVPAAARRAQRADSGKRIVELAPKNVVRNSHPTPSVKGPAPRLDTTKADTIEPSARNAVAKTGGLPAASKPTDADNPLVKPGEVKWHASFQAACEAAKKSGKPVLLFHMMGQLDRQFC
jgi:hypothetical protein